MDYASHYLIVWIFQSDAEWAEVVGVTSVFADVALLESSSARTRQMAVAAVVAEIRHLGSHVKGSVMLS